MKLIRWRDHNGKPNPGIHHNGKNLDASDFGEDYGETFFANDGPERLAAFVNDRGATLPEIPAGSVLDSPVARPSKIVCIGLNYADHARETNATPPAEPVIFLKATTALCGPFDDVILPRDSEKSDWEVELAVVIEKKASYVEESHALQHVAGYCLHNDLSERAFQLEMGGTWDKGKGCDTFAPLGPWLVTKDEIPDTDNLRLWLKLNGRMMQDGNTSNLIFKIPFLVSYVSRFMTLLPGDIISTGTPAGVGLGMKPNLYLKEGDVMELGIDGLGKARQRVTKHAPA